MGREGEYVGENLDKKYLMDYEFLHHEYLLSFSTNFNVLKRTTVTGKQSQVIPEDLKSSDTLIILHEAHFFQ